MNTPSASDRTPTDAAELRIWRCAVPSPLRQLFDYIAPPNSEATPGTRVRVPFGRRSMVAIVVGTTERPDLPLEKLRPVEEVLDDEPLIDSKLQRLLQWLSGYYLHPPGEVFPLALSPRERRGEPTAPTGIAGLRLTLRGRGLPEGALRRAPKQGQLLSLLQQGEQTKEKLKSGGISSAVIRELVSKGLAESCDIAGSDPTVWQAGEPLPPSDEQAAAIDAISRQLGSFHCHVLQGVTGSGKTEVYLQLIAATLARGQQALLLLPEIALTPQMMERVRARFTAPIVELHSGLAEGARDRNWQAARRGEAAVVVGTRSAVFAPLARPGLILVDEEHETSFAQQDGLRYSARDVAIKRAQLSDCPVVLGSATPSLETLDNIVRDRFKVSVLHKRAAGATPPDREIIDVRGLALTGGLSEQLLQAAGQTLAAGNQVLLFINRRGFATALTCHDCGWVGECRHCDARLAVHRQPPRLQCHHCGWRLPLPRQCGGCGGQRLMAAGVGTEQAEQAIAASFSEYPVLRVDSDNIRTRQAMVEVREKVDKGDPAVMVGTQMLAKGHDFPGVTLVGVVDADSLLFSPDFRGEERLLQLLTQVAGRAGRGLRPGRVLIQTRHPEHPLIAELLTKDYQEQANELLVERYQRGLPPAGALALLRCDSRDQRTGLQFLEQVAERVGGDLRGCRLVGPLPAPMARRAGLVRCQLIVSGPDRRQVGNAMQLIVAAAEQQKSPPQLRWFVDIDPIDSI